MGSQRRQDLSQVVVLVLPVNNELPVFEKKTFLQLCSESHQCQWSEHQSGRSNRQRSRSGWRDLLQYFQWRHRQLWSPSQWHGLFKRFHLHIWGKSFDLVVMASDGVFIATTDVRIMISGFLSVPEIAIVVAALVFIANIVKLFCYCKCCSHKISSRYINNVYL